MGLKKEESLWWKNKVFVSCGTIVLFFIILTGFNPSSRLFWFLEAIFVIVVLLFFILTYKRDWFSNTSYILLAFFGLFALMGAYYTYPEVPIGNFFKDVFNLERNHFDRFVHLISGIALAYPFRELLLRTSKIKNTNFWSFTIPIMFAFSIGAFYEIIEWIGAINMSQSSMRTFIAGQGDLWDAQKDMLMAFIGSVFAMTFVYFKSFRINKFNKTSKDNRR